MEHATPISYAAYLAGYISDPSTIRAHVASEFGRAPSLEQCRNLREAKLSARKRVEGYSLCDSRYRPLFRCGHPETDDNIVIGLNGIDKCRTCEERKARELRLRAENRQRKARAEVARKQAEQEAKRINIEKTIEKLIVQPVGRPRVGTDTITAVADFFKITRDDITGKDRASVFVDARAVVSVLMRERGLSYPQIGRFLNRDHSSILNLIRKVSYRSIRNPKILSALEALR